jgi:hypothetical protein
MIPPFLQGVYNYSFPFINFHWVSKRILTPYNIIPFKIEIDYDFHFLFILFKILFQILLHPQFPLIHIRFIVINHLILNSFIHLD